MPETRKLAAILAADVVGFSRLAGSDEERTLARLRALRSDLIDPTTSSSGRAFMACTQIPSREHKGLATTVERKVAECQAQMATAASHRDAAKDRRERLQRGEDVPGGLGKPFTGEDAMVARGLVERTSG
jgi:class 3 adenylate cyclase